VQKTIMDRIRERTVIEQETGCHIWMGMKNPDGYGLLKVAGRRLMVHRLVYLELVGPISDDMCVLHDCPSGDKPSCINPDHLWLGTKGDNNRDRDTKGRGATGSRNGVHTHPEKVARGEDHWAHRYPERYHRGDEHHARLKPECLARGLRNGAYTHPEKRRKGSSSGMSKLTEEAIVEIRRQHKEEKVSYAELSEKHGVTKPTIWKIIKRRTWTHI